MSLTALAAALPTLGPSWLDPETMIETFISRWGVWALAAVCAVVLIETGLLFPFLPGDSLLFTVGLFIGTGTLQVPLWVACLALFLAAFAGDQLGYLIGRKAGPAIFSRPDSRFFKQDHIDKTHAFFEKYGGRAIVLARFVPFVRTYIPVAAGIGRMHYGHFIRFNVIGAFIWGVGVTLLGYFLGNVPIIKDNLEVAALVIVLVSVLPIVIEAIRHRRETAVAIEEIAEDVTE
ncbi:VTT domain-containing protein [Demequina sp. SYSU T00039]|uniref:VTT domain-containing protein n=1 Tax=Demequina lignilytica TaxID=3051663 RepID=A0AAW7M566_9MICO|nr:MULTISPECIES: VTT domain-containing protein [unclassified Demequina]MDN4478748.1 VTT domain-containing protein [Demequina sp. SYSU T00039-1]MDN4488725.1 VTT domain-containing protein [Demequina sp. SYSU T00039]